MPHFLWLWLAMVPMDEAILDVLEEVIAGLYAHCKDLFIDYVGALALALFARTILMVGWVECKHCQRAGHLSAHHRIHRDHKQ